MARTGFLRRLGTFCSKKAFEFPAKSAVARGQSRGTKAQKVQKFRRAVPPSNQTLFARDGFTVARARGGPGG